MTIALNSIGFETEKYSFEQRILIEDQFMNLVDSFNCLHKAPLLSIKSKCLELYYRIREFENLYADEFGMIECLDDDRSFMLDSIKEFLEQCLETNSVRYNIQKIFRNIRRSIN